MPGDDKRGYADVGNLQLSRMMGADVHIGEPIHQAPAQESKEAVQTDGTTENVFEHKDDRIRLSELLDLTTKEGGKPYWIPAGASDHPLGGLGFARWAFEVAAQEDELSIFFDSVIVCAVTGSTMAGMIAGFKLLELSQVSNQAGKGRKRKVIGIDGSARPAETHATVLRLARQTAEKIGLDPNMITPEDVVLDDRYHAGCYGVPDQQTLAAIRYGAATEAFITDPVYEGKSLAGMIDMAKKGEFVEGANVLYAHLGGQLANNAYPGII